MIDVEHRDRSHGFVPVADSIPHFKTKYIFELNCPQISAVSDFRIATKIAIAKEDDALDRRSGGLGLIFYHDWAANTPLDMARAGAAVFFEAYTNYCNENGLDPLQTLVRNGTEEPEARGLLDYAGQMHTLISEAEAVANQ